MKKRVVIIGGGAAGIAAGIAASQGDAEVILLEHQDRIGKKLLITGNGKCNLTNLNMDVDHYITADAWDRTFVKRLLSNWPPQKLLAFFHSIGLRTTTLRESYIYPESEASATVVNVFMRELDRRKVKIHAGEQVLGITRKKGSILVTTDRQEYPADAVILACGGKSYQKTGSDGSGYALLKSLHLPVIAPYPALTSIVCEKEHQKLLSGLRSNALVSLRDTAGTDIKSQYGQIQFTDYGLSGIPVFQISSAVYPYCRQNKCQPSDLCAVINLFPYTDRQDLEKQLIQQLTQYAQYPVEEALEGFLHKKWITFFKKENGWNGICGKDLGKKEIKAFIEQLTHIRFPMTELKGFDFCQVTGGGLPLSAVNDQFELIRFPGIYVVGELLNVTGDCGGYNLHWAFSSGLTAGGASVGTGLTC